MTNTGNTKGTAGILIIFLVLGVAFITTSSIANLTLTEGSIERDSISSLQARFSADAGIEDALLRVKQGMKWSSPYNITTGGALSAVEISDSSGGARTIRSAGSVLGRTRKASASVRWSVFETSFFFGAQVGEGGIEMQENSRIEGVGGAAGNVYSNGPIKGANGAMITGDVTVAGADSIEDVVALGSARANTIKNSKICGDGYFQNIDNSSLNFLNNPASNTCSSPLTPGIANSNQSNPVMRNLSISQTQIDQWKAAAAEGSTISGNCGDSGVAGCIIADNATLSLGPKKITGNLTLTKKQTLVVTGTLYFQGSISLDSASGAAIKCAPSYATESCIIISDSWMHIKNNSVFLGSGTAGSFVLMLTALQNCNGTEEQNQCTHHNSAIDLHNNATGAIFYAPYSAANLHNGVTVTEISARKLSLDNNAIVRYEQGLASAKFSSGPGGSFKVEAWKEIE